MKNKYDLYKQKIQDKRITDRLNALTEQQIQDNFCASLEFGTAGMRGTMNIGTNNINELTVSKLAQSVADYLNINFKNPSCLICFDTRLNSKEFSKIFAASSVRMQNCLVIAGVIFALQVTVVPLKRSI